MILNIIGVIASFFALDIRNLKSRMLHSHAPLLMGGDSWSQVINAGISPDSLHLPVAWSPNVSRAAL